MEKEVLCRDAFADDLLGLRLTAKSPDLRLAKRAVSIGLPIFVLGVS